MTCVENVLLMLALRALEVTAPRKSFSKAADELCVTHGLISQRIRQLEEWLGVDLFDGLGNRVVLSEDGQSHLSSINAWFSP